jgi:magnesium chelatase family protein
MTTDPTGAATARALTVTLIGSLGHLTQVTARIGRAALNALGGDPVLAETRDRIKTAVLASGLPWPRTEIAIERIPNGPDTPASDLALACAALGAAGVVPADRLARTGFVGSLSPDGTIHWVPGDLYVLREGEAAGLRRIVLPKANAMNYPPRDIETVPMGCLADLVTWLRSDSGRIDPGDEPTEGQRTPDLAEVVGQPEARWAAEVAAAGGHNLLVLGDRDTAETIARCLPGLLPPLSVEQQLEVAAFHALGGSPDTRSPGCTEPPFHTPQRPRSRSALLGKRRPGAISLAHHGVLFIDIGDFQRSLLNTLGGVMRDGEIGMGSCAHAVWYPGRFQLVATAARSAPALGDLLDWLDPHGLRVQLQPDPDDADVPESSAVARERVVRTRQRAAARWDRDRVWTNANVPTERLRRDVPELCDVPEGVLRHAWTITDLTECERPGPTQIEAARALADLHTDLKEGDHR